MDGSTDYLLNSLIDHLPFKPTKYETIVYMNLCAVTVGGPESGSCFSPSDPKPVPAV